MDLLLFIVPMLFSTLRVNMFCQVSYFYYKCLNGFLWGAQNIFRYYGPLQGYFCGHTAKTKFCNGRGWNGLKSYSCLQPGWFDIIISNNSYYGSLWDSVQPHKGRVLSLSKLHSLCILQMSKTSCAYGNPSWILMWFHPRVSLTSIYSDVYCKAS